MGYEVTFTKRPLLDFNVPFSEHPNLKGREIGAQVSDKKLKHAQVKAWSFVDKVNGEHVRTKTHSEILKLLNEVPASRKTPAKITFEVGLTPKAYLLSVGGTYEVTFTKRPLLYFNVPFSEHVFTGAKGSVDRLKGSIGAVVSDTKHAQVKAWSAVDKVNGEHVRTKTSAEILKLLEEVPASRKTPVTITFVVGLPPNRTRRRAVLELRRKPNQATRLAERMASVTAEMDVS